MSELFQIELGDFIKLHKFYRKAPRKFQIAASMVLNDFAFGTKKSIENVINDKMIVRNKRFVETSIRLQKTNGSVPLKSMESRVGSIKRDRFSGWEEQQTGKKRKSTRVGALLARGGDYSKQQRGAARMNLSKNYADAARFKGKTEKQKTIAMLNVFKRNKRKQPFVIREKSMKFVPGLYRFFRGKVKILQRFDSKGREQPKKLDWMGLARAEYFRNNPVRETWGRAIKRLLKFK